MQASITSCVHHANECAPSPFRLSKRGVCTDHGLMQRQHGPALQTPTGGSHRRAPSTTHSPILGAFLTVHLTLLLLFRPASAMVGGTNSDGAKRLLLREARLRGASSARTAFAAAAAAAAAEEAPLSRLPAGTTGVEKFSSLPFQLAALIAAEERHELPISTICYEMDADLQELAGRVLTRRRLGAALSLSFEPAAQGETEDEGENGYTDASIDGQRAGDGANLATADADAGAGAGTADDDAVDDAADDDDDLAAARLMATALSSTIFGVTDASDDRGADVSFFRGCDQAEYYDPRNSFVDRVLSRRRGIPISLALLYAEIAARCRMPFVGLNAPG